MSCCAQEAATRLLSASYLDLRREGGEVEGEYGRGSRGQQVHAVQAAVRRALGPVGLHDALEVAAEGVQVAVGGSAGAADGDRRLEAPVAVGGLGRPEEEELNRVKA